MKSIKKNFPLVLAILFTIFTLPMNGLTVSASDETKVYKDGDYKISIEALEENSDNKSAANGFLINEANLSIKGDDITIRFDYTKDFPHDYGINWTKLEKNKPIKVKETDNAFTYTFKTSEIKTSYQASMNYYVAGMPGDMGDENKGHSVDYRIILNEDDLKNLHEKEESAPEENKPEVTPDERKVGNILSEKEADAVYELEYETESKATAGQLENPVKLLKKNNKEYIQISINERGAPLFRSLKFDGKEVTWNSITDGLYTIQFELSNGIEKDIDVSMVIQAGPNAMQHKDIKIAFIEDTLKTIKETKPEKSNTEVKKITETKNINYETIEKKDSSIKKGKTKVDQKGKNGSKEVVYEVTLTDGKETNRIVKKETVIKDPISKIILIGTKDNKEEKKIKDGTYDIKVKAMNSTEDKASGAAGFINEKAQLIIKNGKFKLKIGVPHNDVASIDGIQIEDKEAEVTTKNNVTYYTFDLKKLKQELSSRVQYSAPSFGIINHDESFRFVLEGLDKLPKNVQKEMSKKETVKSKIKINEDDNNKLDKVNVNKNTNEIKPDSAYNINYTIKQKDGLKNSIANDFFTNKGIILEKGNKTYVQMTITEGDMVRALKNKYGEAIVVKQNKDGSIVVQLRVDNNLSNILLDMHIVVPEGAIKDFPGYNENHTALLVFDKNSKQKIDIGNHMIMNNDRNSVSNLSANNGNPGSNIATNNTENIAAGLKNDGPKKPEFGSNSNNKDKNQDKSKNPQTGDLTNIWLYAFLLAGSMLILGIKFRRRTI